LEAPQNSWANLTLVAQWQKHWCASPPAQGLFKLIILMVKALKIRHLIQIFASEEVTTVMKADA
jgi:hypothetical protein